MAMRQPNNTDRQKEDESVELFKKLPECVRRTILWSCGNDFRTKLLLLSELDPTNVDYLILKCVLFEWLTFAKDDADKKNKIHAIVAGSYPAYLGNAVKSYNDIDVFVVVTDDDLQHLEYLWEYFLKPEGWNQNSPYYTFSKDILSVKNFGKIQIIVKYHPHKCLCDFHIDAEFFKDFHHCTRWRLSVFQKYFLPRYMHLQEKKNIICKETAITLQCERKLQRDEFTNRFRTILIPKKYPNKHLTNVTDFGPPSLTQQSLYAILKANCEND